MKPECLYELLSPGLAALFCYKKQGNASAQLGQIVPIQGTQLLPQGPAGRVGSVPGRRQGHIRDLDL